MNLLCNKHTMNLFEGEQHSVFQLYLRGLERRFKKGKKVARKHQTLFLSEQVPLPR